MEMTNLGLTAYWQYRAVREEKCRRVEGGELDAQAQRAIAERDAVMKENKQLLKDKALLKKKLKGTKQESLLRVVEIIKLKSCHKADANNMKKKIADFQTSLDNTLKEKDVLVKKKDELNAPLKKKEEAISLTRQEKECIVVDFAKSEAFKTELVKNIYPHCLIGAMA